MIISSSGKFHPISSFSHRFLRLISVEIISQAFKVREREREREGERKREREKKREREREREKERKRKVSFHF